MNNPNYINYINCRELSSLECRNKDNIGVKEIINNIKSSLDSPIDSEKLGDASLEQLGALSTSENTRSILIDYADSNLDSSEEINDEEIAELLKFVGAMPEYQRS